MKLAERGEFMADFFIQIDRISECEKGLQKYVRELINLQLELRTITDKLMIQTSSQSEVNKKLNELNNSIFDEFVKMNNISNSLSSVVELYHKTENSLLDYNDQDASSEHKDSNTKTKSQLQKCSINWKKEVVDLTKKTVGKVGVVGGLGTGVYEIIKGGVIDGKKSSYVKGTKSIYDTIQGAVKARQPGAGGTQASWKEVIFGLNKPLSKYSDMSKITGAKKAFGSTIKGKVNIKSEGVGWLLTVVASGFDNYDEYKNGDISVKRAFAETIGESAVSIAEGALISSAVSAALVACGFVGAPAIAVGAITVGVSWALDLLCKQITGKGVAEAVSDAVLDVGEKAIKKANEIGGMLKKQVGTATKQLKDGVSSMWKNAARRFSFA